MVEHPLLYVSAVSLRQWFSHHLLRHAPVQLVENIGLVAALVLLSVLSRKTLSEQLFHLFLKEIVKEAGLLLVQIPVVNDLFLNLVHEAYDLDL